MFLSVQERGHAEEMSLLREGAAGSSHGLRRGGWYAGWRRSFIRRRSELSDILVLSCKVASPATDGGTKEKTRHGRRVSTGAD